MARDLSGLRYELDFPLKFRKSFQRQTVAWITAAVVIGVIFALMPARTRKVQVKAKTKADGEETKKGILGAGLAVGALRLAATLLKPAVMSVISKQASSYATGAARRR